MELVSLVRRARVYFSEESAKEILAELVPLISPHDAIAFTALGLIATFLPTRSTHYTPQLVSQFLSMWTWIGMTLHSILRIVTIALHRKQHALEQTVVLHLLSNHKGTQHQHRLDSLLSASLHSVLSSFRYASSRVIFSVEMLRYS
jgi:hypothetical protein